MTFWYCPYGLLLRALAGGWRYAADLGPTHGEYRFLAEWIGEGEPVRALDLCGDGVAPSLAQQLLSPEAAE